MLLLLFQNAVEKTKKNSVCLVVVLFLNRLCYESKLDKIPREFQKEIRYPKTN
jgi:hypothetical protein